MYRKLGLTAVGALFFAGFAAADDHAGGEAIYLDKCANCHFEDDFSGQSAEDIAAMIKGIKSGETKHGADLSGLSDEDIKKVAEYYASQ